MSEHATDGSSENRAEHELSLTRGRLPRWLGRTRTVLAPGACVPHEPRRWTGALVVIEAGTVELEASSGERLRLGCGAILWLAGLPLRALRNPGPTSTTLVAIAKRTGDRP